MVCVVWMGWAGRLGRQAGKQVARCLDIGRLEDWSVHFQEVVVRVAW